MSNTISLSLFEDSVESTDVPTCDNGCVNGVLDAKDAFGKPYTYKCYTCLGTNANLSSRGREVVSLLIHMQEQGLINIMTDKGKAQLGIEYQDKYEHEDE